MREITYTNQYGKSITFTNSRPFVLESIDANSIGTTRNSYKAIGQDGQNDGEITYNARTIICKLAFDGVLNGKYSNAEMERNWQLIASVLLPNVSGMLVYTNNVGTYKIACSPFELPNYENVVATLGKFSIQFVANNPFWQANEEISFRLGSIVGGFSFPFSFNPTVSFGTWVKSCTIENDMGIDTPFLIEMVTVSDYCKITNEKGQFIKVDRPITAGQRLTINTANQEVRLYDVDGTYTLANNKVTLDSTFFKLHYGTNVLTLDNGQLTPAIATIAYNKLYLGV